MNSEVKAISIIGLVTVCIIVGGLALTKDGPKAQSITIDQSLLTSSSTPIKGSANAKVTVIEFGDFACPACAMLAPNLKAAIADYPESVSLGLRLLPIHGEESIKSAIAAYAAGEQGKFYEMGDLLFANQADWVGKDSDQIFIGYATTLGLDVPTFTAKIQSSEFRDQVKDIVDEDNLDATRMKIQSTPTLVINGKTIVVGSKSTVQLKEMIDAELRIAGVATTNATATASSTN